jgi:GNAT superfamily N-acetyltransferase
VHLCRTENRTGETIGQGAGTVAYTGVAFTPEGLPVGHAALRWNQDDIELQRVYVTPAYRGSATAAALLAAAEEAARALRVRRITVRPADQQPDAAGFWERAGFTCVATSPACQSAPPPCFEKVIA